MKIATIHRLVCSTLLVLAGPFVVVAQTGFSDADAAAVQAFLRNNFTDRHAGMVVGILDQDGSRVISAGKLNNDSDQEVNGDTVFELGSVTKVFTSLLALDMARRGEMKLDDPVSKYLPERVKVPTHGGKEITLRNLAAQDSGLPWHPDNLSDRDLKELSLQEHKKAADAYTVEDLYAFLSGHKLTNDPGASFQYSNVGMALLGHAMERQTGADYESLVVSRICRPLQMDSTRITLTPELKARLATGHFADGQPAENINFHVMAASGAVLSSANDLLKFLSANLGFTSSALNPLLEGMQVARHTGDPRFGKTAMPWLDEGVYHPPGSEFLGHGGGGFGYLAFLGFDKRKRRGVVVLSNQMVVNPSGVGWTILQGMPLSRENITFFVREIVGTGMALDADKKTGMLRITTVYPKSPAGRAGLSVGLMIRKIDGISVEGKSLQECLGMISGQAGTKVRFEMFNPEREETNTVELTRRRFVTSTG